MNSPGQPPSLIPGLTVEPPRASIAPDIPDRLRLPLFFDPAIVAMAAAEVCALQDKAWTRHFVEQHFSGQWDVVPLRAPAGAIHPILRIAPHAHISEWEETGELLACPNLHAILRRFLCPVGAARLMRLMPGSRILEHCDPGLDAGEGTARLHVPLLTGPGVDFRLNGSTVSMAVGECWYLRFADPHSAANRGEEPRVHLVLDCTVNTWLADLLAALRDVTPALASGPARLAGSGNGHGHLTRHDDADFAGPGA